MGWKGGAGRGGHGEPQLIEIQVLRCRVSQGDSTYSRRREQRRCGGGGGVGGRLIILSNYLQTLSAHMGA